MKNNTPFIIHVIAPTPFYSGRGTHMRILHETSALAERGHCVAIFTYHIGQKPASLHPCVRICRIRRLLFWYTKRSAGPNWQKILLDILLFMKVFRFALKEKPQILHAHLHEGVLIGWLVKKLLFYQNIVLAGDFHGPLVGEMRAHGYLRFRVLQNLFSRIEKFVHRLPDTALASSPGLKLKIDADRLKHDAAVLSDAPTLTYLAGKTAGPADLLPLRQDPLFADAPCVIYTGGFTPDKGIDALFRVIRHSTRKRGPVYQWLIAGGPSEKLVLPNDIKSLIRVITPLDYDVLAGLLRHADVACEPKQGNMLQGSGKLLNYMIAGVPPVCFDGPAPRFYLGKELAKLLIAKDIGEFYKKIKTLVSLPENEKRKLKKQIQDRAQKFTWRQGACLLEQHYREQWNKQSQPER